METMADSRNLYLLNVAYTATIEDVGYILFLEEQPWVGEVRVEDNIRRLPLPMDFQALPQFRRSPKLAGQGPWQTTAFYQQMEASSRCQ